MTDVATLKGVIDPEVRSWLAPAQVVETRLEHGEGLGGDPVLHLQIIFDDGKAPLDVAKTSRLVRRLLPRLEAVGERAFPIVYYVGTSELPELESADQPDPAKETRPAAQ